MGDPSGDLYELPNDLSAPEDDGAADHLPRAVLPDIALQSTTGEVVPLIDVARETVVLYVYPATGVPGRPLPEGWNQIPGARGCTPQSCAFRERAQELSDLGAAVFGLSAQSLAEQREFAERENIPYPLLHDGRFVLADRLRLPTFEAGGERYYRRLTLIARRRRIVKVFYPVFPPQENAAEVAMWLQRNSG